MAWHRAVVENPIDLRLQYLLLGSVLVHSVVIAWRDQQQSACFDLDSKRRLVEVLPCIPEYLACRHPDRAPGHQRSRRRPWANCGLDTRLQLRDLATRSLARR